MAYQKVPDQFIKQFDKLMLMFFLEFIFRYNDKGAGFKTNRVFVNRYYDYIQIHLKMNGNSGFSDLVNSAPGEP